MRCAHFPITPYAAADLAGCDECLRSGDDWVHLRLCITCGHVGCCDDSKNKHATAHFQQTQHPVIQSIEPGDDWFWCYIDEEVITNEGNPMRNENRDNGFSYGMTVPLQESSNHHGNHRGFASICQLVHKCDKKNLEPTIELAVEIAREGREGRRIGTLFTFGDSDAVLAQSRPLILDPLMGHSDDARHIRNPNLRGTIKELAQLDGAFVISDSGIVVSACRYLDAMASDVLLPYGMASRHLAGASISQSTDAVAIVVSESSMVRIFDDGKLVGEIIPELWLMDRYNVKLTAPYREEVVGDLAVLTASP